MGSVDSVAKIDAVLTAARAGGIDSTMVEIRPARAGQAWLVREYDRSWPTQVDAVAVHPSTLAITSRVYFAEFGMVAKLVQWSIAAHMGILFGLANQLVMAMLGIGLIVLVLYGYRIWWLSRPAPGALTPTLTHCWQRLPPPLKAAAPFIGLAVGWALPALGASLAAFLLVDVIRWKLARRRLSTPLAIE